MSGKYQLTRPRPRTFERGGGRQPLTRPRWDCAQTCFGDPATTSHPNQANIRYFLSKTSSSTAAPCPRHNSTSSPWINKPAPGSRSAPCSHRAPSPRSGAARAPGRAPGGPDRSSLSSPLPEELDSNPPRASGEAGWIQPQTCSNHTLLLPARRPAALPPEPGGGTNRD